MSRATFERAVSLLGELSPAELEQLGTRVAALRALSGPATASTSPQVAGPAASSPADQSFAPLLYSALCEALRAETGVPQPAYAGFLRTRVGASFLRAAEAAKQAHEGWFPDASRQESASLCRLYARCLVAYIQGKEQALHWPVIAPALAKLPVVLDAAFPGYARSGLLSMIRKQPESVAG